MMSNPVSLPRKFTLDGSTNSLALQWWRMSKHISVLSVIWTLYGLLQAGWYLTRTSLWWTNKPIALLTQWGKVTHVCMCQWTGSALVHWMAVTSFRPNYSIRWQCWCIRSWNSLRANLVAIWFNICFQEMNLEHSCAECRPLYPKTIREEVTSTFIHTWLNAEQ